MAESCPNNGRFPTEPTALIITLTTLYLLISLLSADQRESLALAAGLYPLISPYLPRGGR